MKTQIQLIVPMNGDWEEVEPGAVRIGSVQCPYCAARVDVVRSKRTVGPWISAACPHTVDLVDAGGFKMAIHFTKESA